MSLTDVYNGLAIGFVCVALYNFSMYRKRGLRSVALGISSLLLGGVSFLVWQFGVWAVVVFVIAVIFLILARNIESIEKQR
jgi:predicted membrane protein